MITSTTLSGTSALTDTYDPADEPTGATRTQGNTTYSYNQWVKMIRERTGYVIRRE